ncbi:hypothetical protein DV737_g4916, partial [Chaetothyriales sp. CBS 132003]
MHLLLIRHGETEHNVIAERLGKALAERRGLRFSHIFASTLQRAWITADSVQKHQLRLCQDDGNDHVVPQVAQSGLLLEQDFGSFELVRWTETVKRNFSLPDPDPPGFKPRETAEAMKRRADKFIEDFLIPLVVTEGEDTTEAATDKVVVAVVSHGLFLQQLWKNFVVALTTAAEATAVESKDSKAAATPANPFLHCDLRVLAINRSDHLSGLKRDGVGSSPYDFKQQSIKAFFAKRRD